VSSKVLAVQWFFLVGFMGVGKTTLGAKVAEKLALPFFDLDARIANQACVSIREIFESEGEEAFRRRETEMLRQLIANEPAGIMATGGGTFTREVNRNIMATAGVSVWLDAPIDEIVSRVGGDARPLWRSEREARDLAERRKTTYLLANHRLELGTDSTEEGVTRLFELLASYRSDS
jgi:shikimate kinase